MLTSPLLRKLDVLALNTRNPLNSADIRRRFDQASATFDDADFVHAVTRDGLFQRLTGVVVEARRVVDLGCATGAAIRPLAKQFRGAKIVGVDLSPNMLARSKARRGWFGNSSFLQADARALPFEDGSIDVVFCNLLLPWIDEPTDLACEVARVLREDGLFAFSTLGPDSLLELRRAWSAIDEFSHVNHFLDMHNVGDAMLKGGLRDPVLDVDRLDVSYESVDTLFRDLTAIGGRNSLRNRRQSLTGKAAMAGLRQALQHDAGTAKIPLKLELVYGHCWGSGSTASNGDVRIDAGTIPIRRR